MIRLLRHCLALWLLCCALTSAWAEPPNSSMPEACLPQFLGSWSAQELEPMERPTTGWDAVQLPDEWRTRWFEWPGPTWYRIDWQLPCPDEHYGLSISTIRSAGTVYWNDELLWSDRHLTPPYSRSANMPRWWPLSTQGKHGVQSVWVRVVSHDFGLPGLGRVMVGPAAQIRDAVSYSHFRQRTGYTLTAAMSLAIGCVTLCLWLWRRSENAYLWFGLMELMWAGYLCLLLQTEPVWGLSSTLQSKVQLTFFLLYAQSFWMFSLRFMELRFPKLEAFTWLALAGWFAAFIFQPDVGLANHVAWLLRWGALLVHCSCILVIIQALRTRKTHHLWLALCWFGVLLVASHDIVVAVRVWDYDQTWAALLSPVSTLFLAGMLGWQLASYMRRVDSFNAELQRHVEVARNELSQVLSQQHAQELEHAKLQERVHLAHDLHDGLGGSLVRSLALVEQASTQLDKDRVLSMLKVLRDDLRQVIDLGSSREISVPETPILWLAPLRHRFTSILDELGLHAQWQVDTDWLQPPSALQCMAMARFLEEAFANVLKHSRARQLHIRVHQPSCAQWVVSMADDGVGFDVDAVLTASMGVGMHSMQARLQRVGGQLQIQSSPQGTVMTAEVSLQPAPPDTHNA